MRFIAIILCLLTLMGCDLKWGPADKVTGPSNSNNAILISYADVKSNYLKSPVDFPAYINKMDNIEWVGKIVSIDINKKTTIYVGGSSSNPLILTVSSDLVAEVGSKITKTINFQAKITNYIATGGSFTLIGKLIKLFPE